ncbi:MAG: 5'/3'-nucleotidase SurE [Pseudomonadota bacterium]
MSQSHRILVTNDDGIQAPGLALLEAIARSISEDVWVVAPDSERSGFSHSVSLTQPVRMQQLGDKRYQVSGTPTDCVLLAACELMPEHKPTLVLSGINGGANLSEDVSYSGTAAAAMEGTLMGIRALALSQLRNSEGVPDFAVAERFAPDLVRELIALEHWPKDSFININFPAVAPSEISGTRITRMGQRPPGAFSVLARQDARKYPYYWISITYPPGGEETATDLEAVAEKAISITPIKMDFTDHHWRAELEKSLSG